MAAVALVVSSVLGFVPVVGPGTDLAIAAAQRAGDVVYDGSPDGLDGSVYRLYQAFFLREPDADGLLHWIVAARHAGYPLGAVAEDFARSAEFRGRYGDVGNGAFLDLVYRNVMGRAPDGGGRAYWLAHLARGMPRGHVMVHFSDSVEYARKVGAGPFGQRDFRGPARPAPSATPGSWHYLDPTVGGRAVAWPRCQPIYVVANPDGIPAGEHAAFEAMVRHALDRVSTATGQDWVYLGRTAYRATDRTSVYRTLGAVAISFMSAPEPGDRAAAWGNTVISRDPRTGAASYVAGTVSLNATHLVHEMGGRVTPLVATTLMHELGHVAGLDHTDDRSQLMWKYYEVPAEPAFEEYRAGDRAGLARVGSVTVAC